jgi:Flp pilus assembly protein TadB
MDNVAIETTLKLVIAAAAAITGWMAVLRPLLAVWKTHRQQRRDAIAATLKADKEYRQSVLNKLDTLDNRLSGVDSSIAELQRDNIERAHCMFVLEHKYCPSGMKSAILDMYESYRSRGYNHIAESRIQEILDLPEYPPR